MITQLNIGIVGLGYVGKAIRSAYEVRDPDTSIHTFDINDTTNPTCAALDELVQKTDIIYVCVPTPMTQLGECDTTIVETVVNDICQSEIKKIVVIKSTVTPGTTERLQSLHPTHTILFCPEFLTEQNYIEDYLDQDLMIVGVPKNSYAILADVVLQEQMRVCNVRNYKIVDSTTAEFYKYLANIFLATKVSFANEMESVAQQIGVSWQEMIDIVLADSRLGRSHWKVPGPDGRRGFGGTCFPKDISAFIQFAGKLGVPIPVLKSVWNRNIMTDRPEKDWEQLKGRAVT